MSYANSPREPNDAYTRCPSVVGEWFDDFHATVEVNDLGDVARAKLPEKLTRSVLNDDHLLLHAGTAVEEQ